MVELLIIELISNFILDISPNFSWKVMIGKFKGMFPIRKKL